MTAAKRSFDTAAHALRPCRWFKRTPVGVQKASLVQFQTAKQNRDGAISDRTRILRVFTGEQRAIGERMIRDGARGPECAGYGTLLEQLTKAPDTLVEFIRNDVGNLNTRLEQARPRLVALQNALIDLLAFLDPDFVRFPIKQRTRVNR
jgi:hypothetical protein